MEKKIKRMSKQKAQVFKEICNTSWMLKDFAPGNLLWIHKILHENIPTYEPFFEAAGMYKGDRQLIEFTDKAWTDYQKAKGLKNCLELVNPSTKQLTRYAWEPSQAPVFGVVFTVEEPIYLENGEPVPGRTKEVSFVKEVYPTLDDPVWFAFVTSIWQVMKQNDLTIDEIIEMDNK
jgi:hypothetical protein